VRYDPLVPTFTRDDVQRLARLARLDLAEDEIDLFTRQLGDILEFARQIQSVDTTGATPMSSTVDATALRDDMVQASLERTAVLAEAPDADRTAGLFKVPRVMKP
jgi:aspartyl-tRNA(Asn)/glutamyl-tRNA(Gln) amidotransferase subunit C